MSMLAEPRRKQKWTLNPRGKQWSEDSNKFGQKMLEKMGWTSGKGLGANEQGMTEHVRVSLKNDMAGIGFNNDDIDKAWTEHQDSFNDFLQKLQQDSSSNVVQTEESKGELSGKSLELKSKQSRARVHYQKFTRGKDVNKYSSKDLANIFGQKELNVNKDDKNKQDNSEEGSDPIGSQENRGGVITIHGGNMADYFKKKGQDFSSLSREKRPRENDSESEPEYAGFGFASTSGKKKSADNVENRETQSASSYAFENPCVELNSPENSPSFNNECKSSKKRKAIDASELSSANKTKKFKEDKINENGYKNGFANAGLNLDCQTDEVCNGKEFEVSRVQFGVTNTALDLSDESEDKKRVTFNDHVEYSTDSVKKKNGRSMLDKFEVKNKKAKKKKKHKDCESNPVSTGFVNEALDVEDASEEVHDNEVNERKSKKSKKRKGSRRSNLETIVEMPEEDKEIHHAEGSETKRAKTESNVHDQDVSIKKKKKKHKEKTEEVVETKRDAEEIAESEVISEANRLDKEDFEVQEDEENISKKKKKKKKSKDKECKPDLEKDENIVPEDNTTVHNTEIAEEEIIEVEVIKVKKKKKKSKKESEADDIDTKEINSKEEKEVSDKENTSNVQETETKKSKKKKLKKSVDESVNNRPLHNTESTEESVKEGNSVECNTPSENASNERFNNTSSPWNRTARMPKRLLKSLFQRHSIQNFPGSNIHEIKGYGADV